MRGTLMRGTSVLPSWVDFLIFLSLYTCKNVLPAIFPNETWVLSVRDFSRTYPTKKNLGAELQVRLPTCPILSISNYQESAVDYTLKI